MIVSKIGGSSLGDKKCFMRFKEVIKSDEKRKVIVVSAPGKRFSDDEKITDLLISCFKKAENKESFLADFSKIENRFLEISEGLACFERIKSELKSIKSALFKATYEDYIISRGEYLCAITASCLLNYTFIDPSLFMFFDSEGKIDEKKSSCALQKLYRQYPHMVIPGFYGISPNGKIKTFPRGGSDITGSFVSAFLHAEKYENMTDVSGLFMAPPCIYPNSSKIDVLKLENLKILSHFSNGVFNEGAVDILIKHDIPLEIKNTFSGEKGTISLRCPKNPELIAGMGAKKGTGETMLILLAGKVTGDGLFAAFLLNCLCNEKIAVLGISKSKFGEGLIFNISKYDFEASFCILYKVAEQFKEGKT